METVLPMRATSSGLRPRTAAGCTLRCMTLRAATVHIRLGCLSTQLATSTARQPRVACYQLAAVGAAVSSGRSRRKPCGSGKVESGQYPLIDVLPPRVTLDDPCCG